jgi:hypothetical protein
MREQLVAMRAAAAAAASSSSTGGTTGSGGPFGGAGLWEYGDPGGAEPLEWGRAVLAALPPTRPAKAFPGHYDDPRHPGCPREVLPRGAGGLLVRGSDEGGGPFVLKATQEGAEMSVDFRPKGGPRALRGTRTEEGIAWADGNAWRARGGPSAGCAPPRPPEGGGAADGQEAELPALEWWERPEAPAERAALVEHGGETPTGARLPLPLPLPLLLPIPATLALLEKDADEAAQMAL